MSRANPSHQNSSFTPTAEITSPLHSDASTTMSTLPKNLLLQRLGWKQLKELFLHIIHPHTYPHHNTEYTSQIESPSMYSHPTCNTSHRSKGSNPTSSPTSPNTSVLWHRFPRTGSHPPETKHLLLLCRRVMNSSPHSTLGLLTEKNSKQIGSDIAKRRSSIELLEQENGELRQISHPTKLPLAIQDLLRQTNATNPHQIQTSTRRLFGSVFKALPSKSGLKQKAPAYYARYSHSVYNRAEPLFRTLHKLMCMREDAFQTLQSRLPHYRIKQQCRLYQSYTLI